MSKRSSSSGESFSSMPSFSGTKIKDRYILRTILGKGAYGVVYRATDTRTGKDVAVKIMDMTKNTKIAKVAAEELAAYGKLSKEPNCHSFVVCLYDYFLTARYIYIVLEMMERNVMDQLPETQSERLIFLHAVIAGLAYIHGKGYAHRDIKGENILVRGSTYKYADMGMICGSTKAEGIPSCSVGGTLDFVAPELDLMTNYNKPITLEEAQKGDVWSLGVTIYEVFTSDLPFVEDANNSSMTQDQVYKLNETERFGLVSANFVNDFVNSMLQVDPGKRPTSKTLLDSLEREMSHCSLGDGRYLNQEKVREYLDQLKIRYSADASFENLCSLLKSNLQCVVKDQPLTTKTVATLADVFGIKGSPTVMCAELTHMATEQNLIDKRRVAEVIHGALSQSAIFEVEQRPDKVSQIDKMIKTVLAVAEPDGIDYQYLRDQFNNARAYVLVEHPGKTLDITNAYIHKYLTFFFD